MQKNFPEHFVLWEFDKVDVTIEEVADHFKIVVSSSTSFYMVKDEQGIVAAVVGISATDDKQLAFQTLAIVRVDLRDKGLMAAVLQRAINDYPEAIITAYLANQQIRNALGESSITQPSDGNNQVANIVDPSKGNYLQDTMEKHGVALESQFNTLSY